MRIFIFLILCMSGTEAFSLNVQQLPDFKRNLEGFEACFKLHMCGDTPIEVPGYDDSWSFAKKKSAFFNEVAANCMVERSDNYKAAYIPSDVLDSKQFTYNFELDGQPVQAYLFCRPLRNFEEMVKGSKCAKDYERNSSFDSLKEIANKIRANASIDETTACAEKSGSDGDEKVTLKEGYTKNPQTGECEKSCKGKNAGMLVKKLKKGYTYDCDSKDVDDQNTDVTCSLADSAGHEVTKKIVRQEKSGFGAMFNSEALNFPAKYYEIGCRKCGDRKFFSSDDYSTPSADGNTCEDENGCKIGEEMVPGAGCKSKCGRGQKRNKNLVCHDDDDKICEYLTQSRDAIQNWPYKNTFGHMNVQRCQPKDFLRAVGKAVNDKLKEISGLIDQCNSDDGLPDDFPGYQMKTIRNAYGFGSMTTADMYMTNLPFLTTAYQNLDNCYDPNQYPQIQPNLFLMPIPKSTPYMDSFAPEDPDDD